MPMDVSSMLIGNAVLWYSNSLASALPADNLAVGANWPTGWIRAGLTGAPLKMGYEYDVADADVEESLAPVDRAKTKENTMLETTLREIDPRLLPLIWDGVTVVTPQSSGVAAKSQFNIGGRARLLKRMWGFEGIWVDAAQVERPHRCIVYKATASTGAALEFSKGAWAGVPFKIGALADMNRPYGDRLFTWYRVESDPG